MKTGACYIRVSTDKQEELSPDAQKRLLLKYAGENHISIPDTYIFIEHGISGRKASKRPEFQKMIGIAKSDAHPLDVILVWKFSRFARNQEESIVYKSMLRKDSVDVISVSEPLIEGPFGSLIERIIEWMDEYYSIRLSGEVVRGMTEKALRGGYQAASPLGYQSVGDGKPPILLPQEADIITFIFDCCTKNHLDSTAIARKANACGFRTKRGNLFDKRGIQYILQNPFYTGKVRWNHSPRSSSDSSADEVIIACGTHEVLISEDQFSQAAIRLKQEFGPQRKRNLSVCRHWLSGIVKCPVCGANLAYNFRSGKGGSFFQCYNYSNGKHPESIFISESKLSNAVYDSLKKLFGSSDIRCLYDTLRDNSIDYTVKGRCIRSIIEKILYNKQDSELHFYYRIPIGL